MVRFSRIGLVLAGAILFSACGSDNVVQPPPPTPPPATPPPPFVIYGDNGSVPADSVIAIDFSIPNAGAVTATVDWTLASNDVWIAMTTSACNDFVEAFVGQCSHIGNPNIGNAKPKTVTGSVTQAASARLWIANFATEDESMAVQIILARSSATSTSETLVLERRAGSWTLVPGSATRALRPSAN